MGVSFSLSSKVAMKQNSDIFSEFEINRPGSPLIQCASVCAQSVVCYGVELCNTKPKCCRLWGATFTNDETEQVTIKCARYTKVWGCSHPCDSFDSTGVQTLIVHGRLMEVYKCFRGNHMWTVVQRRLGGSVLFNRNWSSYKNGFGSLSSEFWLGNENIHLLTKNGHTYLRFDLMESNGECKYAEYRYFYVDTEENMYKLTVSGYSGNAGDDMDYHNGMNFTTSDVTEWYSCASVYEGGWWFRSCYHSFLNGEYGRRVHWGTLTSNVLSLKEVVMMIRKP
ncbi:ficolin-1-like [Saccostrea echinata]|uniref:ficolin-1-like n=1 Tax=Saccostrea echinata TaxID=191078 RepID=UPI002A81AFFD|nr:ficolin-1-like [Saccostrea echinata]